VATFPTVQECRKNFGSELHETIATNLNENHQEVTYSLNRKKKSNKHQSSALTSHSWTYCVHDNIHKIIEDSHMLSKETVKPPSIST